jgi:hypothetical protein
MAKTDSKLRATDTEGVFLNEAGQHVDSKGVSVAFKALRAKDQAQRAEALGKDVALPHELLWALAQDPRYPVAARAEWAHKAAPYYAAKKELGAPQGDGDLSPEEFASRTREALEAIEGGIGRALPRLLRAQHRNTIPPNGRRPTKRGARR